MQKRKIPSLQNDPRMGETRLVHVTTILRHGARTPYTNDLNCWEGYDAPNSPTSTWDCNLTTYLAPPPPNRLPKHEKTDLSNENHDQAMFLFEKRYDALQFPNYTLSNYFRGTCQLGQLLMQGYEQELQNGKFLREAYVYDETRYDHDPRMRLIDVKSSRTNSAAVWENDGIRYRVDDDQRTLMSGQVVLRGLFGPEIQAYYEKKHELPIIPLHTVDRNRDVLEPNERVCPRLSEIADKVFKSRLFQAFNTSQEAHILRSFQNYVLKKPDRDEEMEAIDCLMTTMCTDRPLPKAVDDYNRSQHNNTDTQPTLSSSKDDYGDNLFQRLYDFDVQSYTLLYKANDAEYSKLAMGPLWHEVRENILPFVQNTDDMNNNAKRVKLVIVSGHDTTIMPFLIALGSNLWRDRDWPSYASMVIMEIHEVNVDGNTDRKIFRSNFAFRLLYNGQVLTSLVDGCTDGLELCDWNVLSNRIEDFAILDRDCESRGSGDGGISSTMKQAEDFLSTTGGIVVFLVVVSGSMLLGSVSVWVYLTGSISLLLNGLPTSELDAHMEDGQALTSDRYSSDKKRHHSLPHNGTIPITDNSELPDFEGRFT
jgi:hypothetical protein